MGSSEVLGYSGCLPRSLCSQVCFPLPPFLWGGDGDDPLIGIWPFGMATISNDSVERVNRFRKQTCNKHNDRGGSKQKATGQSACGRPEAFVDLDANALVQVLQWVYVYFHIHPHQHDALRHVPCDPWASLDTIPHCPLPLLSSLLYSAPQHGHALQQRYAGNVDQPIEGNAKHAGGSCMCVNMCIVHRAQCVTCASWHAMAPSGLCYGLRGTG